jgi:hypothetical protein
LRESREEAFARTRRGFDVRIIAYAARLAGESILCHSVEDKTVKAIAGPRVADAQSFENEEGLGKRGAMLVAMKAASGDHPIKDVGAGPRGRLIAVADADGGNRGQRDLSSDKRIPRVVRDDREFSLEGTAGGRQRRRMLLDILCWQDKVCLPPRKPNRKGRAACYAESR